MHCVLNVKINSANTFFWDYYLGTTNFSQNMPVLSRISEEQVLSFMPQADAHFTVLWALRGSFFLRVWQNMVTAAETEMPDVPFPPNLTFESMKQLISWGVQALAGGTPVQCPHPSHSSILLSFLSIKENIVPMPSVKQSAACTL